MREILSAAGRSFLRAFIGSLIVFAPGILDAPDLHHMYLLGVAAIIASLAAALKVLQQFVPQLSVGSLLPAKYKAYAELVDSFVRAFLGALIVGLTGVLGAPDFATAKALAVAAIVGALTAAIRALQGAFTKGDVPAPEKGF